VNSPTSSACNGWSAVLQKIDHSRLQSNPKLRNIAILP
jgi:hypothetical protein